MEIVNKKKWYHFLLVPIVFIIGWLYILTLLQVFNIIANAYWLIKLIISGKYKAQLEGLRHIKHGIKSIADVEREYKLYNFIFDGITKGGLFKKWPTWIPLPIVFLAKERKDNCDGSQSWLSWLMKQLHKNDKSSDRYKYKQKIFVPLLPWKLDRVHYIGIIYDMESPLTDPYKCYSNGKITSETYDDLALRFLCGDQRYTWIK